jgi:hypothetical protein
MAGRNFTPVQFGLEKNIVSLYSRALIGANGAVTLDTSNSKGICNIAVSTPIFTGTTSSGSATINSVSSFNNLFTGMTLSGGGANGVIGTMTAATASIVMSAPATAAGSATITATGGQYIVQFGTQAGVRLDSYAKLLDWNYTFDESNGSANGSYQVLQVAPAATQGFIVENLIKTRTIPAVGTSNSTDCTVIVQFGNGAGSGFVAATPASGEVLRMSYTMGNSTAP